MKWTFANNDGGRASGFHDAGVETFKGNFDRYLARELIQNSLDARLDAKKPVGVVFLLDKFKRKDVPDIDGLKIAFVRSKKYWAHDKKAVDFFEHASRLAGAASINVLRVSDFNTTGVLGSDTEKEKNWFNLIRSAGSSSKGGGEGGSFGLGKNAPFAASQMRTVFYTTFNSDNEYIFQGVAMLVSHIDEDGRTVQPVGYLGEEGGASIRKKANIPELFLREKIGTKKSIMGTEISILAFDARENWQEDLIYSVLDNFWVSIEFGDLEVIVGDQKINRETLPALLQKFSAYEDFNAHLYYEAYKNPTLPVLNYELPNLKAVNLYLRVGEKDLPKKVLMVRKTGMKIFEKAFRSIIPFIGVFICRNDEGNKRLRDMEPPRHDVWDPDYPDKGKNKRIEHEYGSFIRGRIKELTPVDDSDIILIPELNRYLPDDDDLTDNQSASSDESSSNENFDKRHLPEKIIGQVLDRKKQKLQRNVMSEEPGEYSGGTGEGEFSGEYESDGQDGGKNGKRKNKPGRNEGTAGVTDSDLSGPASRSILPIRFRTFLIDYEKGVYRANIKPERNPQNQVELFFWVIGDDQKVSPEIHSARFASGENIPVSKNHVGPLFLPIDGVQVEIILKTSRRLSMEVIAHEIV